MSSRVHVLGSTGSIGTQALEVIAETAERASATGAPTGENARSGFDVVGLSAGGSRPDLLARQIRDVRPEAVAVSDVRVAERIRSEFPDVRVFDGESGATELVRAIGADVVLNGIDGMRGLGPTLAALDTGAKVALANKESLVSGGRLVLDAAGPGQLVPVDSEHSAMAQCLRGGSAEEVDRLVLTASGGPFRGRTRDELVDVTPEQAAAHPTWSMGTNITLNSATLVNKALELIEAHLLFDVPYDRIDVVVHPQSVVHSAVTFSDGATIAKASPPSMKLPIALALHWPDRFPGAEAPLDWTTAHTWTFEPVDNETFPALDIAREAGRQGGLLTAVYNAANEVSAPAFLDGRIPFPRIVDVVGETVAAATDFTSEPRDIDDVLAAGRWATDFAAARVAEWEGRT